MVVGDQAGSESFKSLNTVEFDQYSMGAKLAQKLLADNNGTLSGKKIGIYCENTESDACKKRIDGIKDTLAESGCVVMWIVSGVSDTGEKINLQSQRKVDIVLAIDDASVVDAAKEASDNNLQGALVYGIGNSTEAIYYLDSGWTEALITPDEFAAGYKSVVGLVDMLRGSRKYSVEEKPVSYQLLTRKICLMKKTRSFCMQSASSGGTINEKQNKKYHDNTVFCTDIVICLVQQQKS